MKAYLVGCSIAKVKHIKKPAKCDAESRKDSSRKKTRFLNGTPYNYLNKACIPTIIFFKPSQKAMSYTVQLGKLNIFILICPSKG